MILKDITFTIPREEVLLGLKFNLKKSEMSASLEKILDEMMDEGYILSHAQAIYETAKIAEKEVELTTYKNTDFSVPSQAIAELLADCYQTTFLVCTVGSELTEAVEGLMKEGELTKATILDSVASEAVEAVANKANDLIRQEAEAQGATLTRRFSPGYGDWPITEHPRILSFLHANDIGVTSKESHLLLPEKSITACIGWKKNTYKPARKALDY